MSDRVIGAAMVIAAAVAFSGKAVIVKLAYRYEVDAVTLLALRMLMSAPFFLLIAWWAARGAPDQPIAPVDRRNVAILGLIGYYLASYFDFLGLQSITAALERLILFIHPTFVLLLSAAFFKRAITLRDAVAVCLSYLGIALAFGSEISTQPGNVWLGTFWVLVSALLYAVYLMGSGRVVGRVGSLRFASHAGLAACLGVLAHYAIVNDMSAVFGLAAPVYGLALLMAVGCTVLPIVLTSEGIRRIGASHASIIASVGPVATIFLGFAFLGEPITAMQIAGAAMVMAGVLAIGLHKKG